MKESESSFDVTASVKELQALIGGRVDKIFHPDLDHLVLVVRRPSESKSYVHFFIGRWLYVSDRSQEMPAAPSDFAMMLRKRITNARIVDVRQQGFDRIAVISLEKEDKYELVLELFGDGNVILIQDGIIIQPLTSHTWKHRDVRARREFSFPPPVPVPMAMQPRDLLMILNASDTDLVRTLATKLNIGGRYSEEICARAGIDKKKMSKEIDENSAKSILETINSFRDEVLRSVQGLIVLKEESVEDVVPVRLSIYEGHAQEEFQSYSQAVESYVSRIPKKQVEERKESRLELERLQRKLAQQENAVIALQDQAREAQLHGDYLFANYEDVDRILTMAKDRLAEEKPLTDLPGFLSFDRKSSIMKVLIKTTQVELNPKGTVQSNAQMYYEGAKKARHKLEGVLAALDQAKKEIYDLKTSEAAREPTGKKKLAPTKRFWFERFRWFVSSEGAIVLGGKDAKSNDMLVKKHLAPGDRYAHADVHGAPSVVVKMREGVTEATLHEACEFAVATSRAWNANIGSAAGYWVLPEQVSKTPESGEYLAKGAFIIRGRRNYSDKLEIKLGLGEIEYEGTRKIMCGPEMAIRAHSQRYVMIRPGREDKNDFAKKAADVFQVPIEEIQSILPPGDIKVVEQVGISVSSQET
ncbi:MAG: hypothetical protein A3K60_04210 [Euryarchaeota archaeon RBG_19FT_COMBO_56_21]|nr:MAG: hypothetical protein A3K60_04210 [Euryarchaeota archaeon RBG_19FT_COMBO_56_21]